MENKTSQNNENTAQNTQNLEPMTPRTITRPTNSFFNKAKDFFVKKNVEPNQFAVRKEPTFGETQTQSPELNSINTNISTSVSNNSQATNLYSTNTESGDIEVENETVTAENDTALSNNQTDLSGNNVTKNESDVEKEEIVVIPQAKKSRNPENWAIMQKLPQKHRRLIIALVVLLLIFIFIWMMKPSKDTVEDFSNNNGNMPIEFQPLDQSQPFENADVNNIVAPTEQPVDPAPQPVVEPAIQPQPQQSAEQTTVQQQQIAQVQQQTTDSVERPQAVPVIQQPVRQESKPVAQKPVVTTQKSATPAKTETKRTVEQKPVTKTQKTAQKPQVVDAKPSRTQTQSSSSKTLTIPKGVTLMQVFRDNGLNNNISDVNAMTKAQGANGVLSSFKPGDKVQISLNSQGKVSQLRLTNGGTFTRQSDGTYKYQK